MIELTLVNGDKLLVAIANIVVEVDPSNTKRCVVRSQGFSWTVEHTYKQLKLNLVGE